MMTHTQVVLAFPTNQFGHQENSNGQEILNALKYVRPGNGFQPKCIMMDKVECNGAKEHPVFAWLKSKLPTPSDNTGTCKRCLLTYHCHIRFQIISWPTPSSSSGSR